MDYIAHVWSRGTRNLLRPREQVVVHRADGPCGALIAASTQAASTHPISQTEVEHYLWVPNVIWPCKNCCRHLQEFVTAPPEVSTPLAEDA